jgi:membrane peptidoglycan carboxypeptidase
MGYPIEPGLDGKRGTGDDFVPRMGYCEDPNVCRPVHGIEVTGGSFPAQIWNLYMQQAVAELEIANFQLPSDLPDEVINPVPSVEPEPTPTKSKTPKPEPTEPDPTPEPEPTEPGPTPEPEPTEPDPTPPSDEGFASISGTSGPAGWVRRGGPP